MAMAPVVDPALSHTSVVSVCLWHSRFTDAPGSTRIVFVQWTWRVRKLNRTTADNVNFHILKNYTFIRKTLEKLKKKQPHN